MTFTKRRRPKKKRWMERSRNTSGNRDRTPRKEAGSESAYLKSLVDSRAKVTVVLKSGERLQGRIRYYDRYCFSVGLSARGPKIFLRKENVSYISEE